ncbi:MAG: DUF4190 domain-containing protein [Planctomycetota bacterium]
MEQWEQQNQASGVPSEGGPQGDGGQGGGGRAVASLVLGCVAMIAWCIPLVGLPVAVVGLVLGILDRQSSKRGMAIAGIVLSAIGLALSLVNGVVGAYLAISGQSQLLGP